MYSAAERGLLDNCTTAPCGTGTIDAAEEVAWGYQLGAGAEFSLARNWSVKAEYAYYDFGKTKITGTGLSGVSLRRIYNTNADLSVQVIKAGLNYRF